MARYHILIVDDQRDVRLLLRTSLETLKLDLEIIDVPSAEEALLILGKEQIDLMVVDVRLPGMSGLELHDRAGKRTPTTQLILITGLTDENVQRQIAEAGATAYFYKPIQIGRFLDVVCNCLGIQTPGDNRLQKSQSANLPLPVQPSFVRQFGELCAQQDALRGWIMSAQRKILVEWENSDHRGEFPRPEKLMMGLLEQDRQQIQSVAGMAFPCHHLFTMKEGDLWITSLKSELVLSILLPEGTGIQKATPLLSEIDRWRAGNMTADLEQNAPQIIEEIKRSEVDDEFDAKLSALLGQATEHGLRSEDLAAFWDHLIQEDQAIQTGHGVMSYEEAVRMGLAKGGQIT